MGKEDHTRCDLRTVQCRVGQAPAAMAQTASASLSHLRNSIRETHQLRKGRMVRRRREESLATKCVELKFVACVLIC